MCREKPLFRLNFASGWLNWPPKSFANLKVSENSDTEAAKDYSGIIFREKRNSIGASDKMVSQWEEMAV
jgi:hypothetical protein